MSGEVNIHPNWDTLRNKPEFVAGDGIIINGIPGSGVDPFSSLIVAGSNVTVSYDSNAQAWTINSSGGGGGGGGANLSVSTTTTAVTVASDSGTDATIASASGSAAGVMTAALFTKLSGIATGATANSADATLLARANHTGTQAWSTITSTPTTLSGYGITDGITSAAVSAGYQPLDSDLTAIAALSTTSFGRSLLTQADAAAARTTLGAGTSSFDGAYSSLSGIPSTFTPSSHNHAGSEITSGTVDPARLGSGTSISTKFLRGDSTWQTISGGGDALTSGNLSQFAATTSAQLAGVISDETGSGALVFANTPTLVTPILGTPTSGTLTNCTGYAYSNLTGTPSTFAPAAHNHTASEITSGTLDITRIPTGSSASTVCIGNDARLSDARTPTSHIHGNITNAGAIGSTANLPIITTTSGVLTTGSFGTTANTFCQGNDSRLSDARTPTTHAISHQSGGSDAIKLDDLATPDDNTDLDATTTRHGLLPKLGGGTTNFLRADGTWAAPSGGSTSDMLSVLTAAEISVTGTATLTIGRMHVCSGTGSDYTVTLPAASGNAGRFVGVRMAGGLTRLVTVDGNSTELIDGEQTRVMWANESAILLCDGTGWTKISGRSFPLKARFGVTGTAGPGTQSLTNLEATKVQVDTIDVQSLDMANTTTDEITIRRTGSYRVTAALTYNQVGAESNNMQVKVFKGSGEVANVSQSALLNAYPVCLTTATLPFVASDVITLRAYHSTGSNTQKLYVEPQTGPNYLEVVEVVSW